jgi:hypothetical protein
MIYHQSLTAIKRSDYKSSHFHHLVILLITFDYVFPLKTQKEKQKRNILLVTKNIKLKN